MPLWVELHREWVLCAICNGSFKSGGDGKWLPQSQPQPFCHCWVGKEVRRGLTLSHLYSRCQHTFHPLAIPSVPGGRGAGQDPVIPSVPGGRGAGTEETSQGLPSGICFDSALLPLLTISGLFPPAPGNKCALPVRGFQRGWREKKTQNLS